MSALRKLRALRQQDARLVDDPSAAQQPIAIEEAEEKQVSSTPALNPFTFLDEEEEQVEDEEIASAGSPNQRVDTIVSAAKGTKQKKAKKKRRPTKGGNKKKVEDEVPDEDDDYLDEILQEFSIDTADERPNILAIKTEILCTTAKFLDAEREIKLRFGSSVAKDARCRRIHNSKFRKTILVHPEEKWPPLREKLLEMRLTEPEKFVPEGGEKWFELIPSQRCQSLDLEYLSCVQTHDPQAISYFGRKYPYHAQCLLQLSHLCESSGDFTSAQALIQRCVYMYESCFSTDFKFLDGTCRLDCENEAHHPFFAALYRHSQLLGKTGCPRAGLEVAKMLLSLSPHRDPQCVLFAIDYLSIRAEEYQYLLKFCSHFNPASYDPITVSDPSSSSSALSLPIRFHFPPACLLPNICYSAALAKFLLERKGGKNCQTVDSSAINCNMYQQDLEKWPSSLLLQASISLFPEVLEKLLTKASDTELNKSVWKDMLPKLASMQPPHPYVDKMTVIFAERSHNLWSDDDILTWVRQNAQEALRKWQGSSIDQQVEVTRMRGQFYSSHRPIPVHVRMLGISHYSDEVPAVPEELRRMNEIGQMQREHQQQERGLAPGQQALPLDQNPVAVLLMSLLPWYGVPAEQR